MKKNCLLTDSVCDLSVSFLESIGVESILFFLQVNSGVFMDGYEISTDNVIEYYKENGTQIISHEPSVERYERIYREKLQESENVIHFTISSLTSSSYKTATAAREKLDEEQRKHIYIIDTKNLSGGMAILLMRASRLNARNVSALQIVEEINNMIPRVDTSFVTPDAGYLVINKRVEPWVNKVCSTFQLRPVFSMVNGDMKPEGFGYGKRERYLKRYIRSRLKKADNIDDEMVFILHSTSNKEELEFVTNHVKSLVQFKNVYTVRTSATVACNCGPGTVGVIFLHKK